MFETRRGSLLAVAAFMCLSLGSVGCGGEGGEGEFPREYGLTNFSASDWVSAKLERMTLEEKVGQLFMTYVYGQSATDTTQAMVDGNRKDHGVDTAEELIERYRVGGIIYFTWSGNLQTPQQIATLSNSLQQVALRQTRPVPLLISTDQEHGVVVRVTEPATQFPGSMALGATRNPEDARLAGEITALELRAMGINQNFGPVSDVNSNPLNPVIGVRSFGVEPALVASLTQMQVKGMQKGGAAATAKHFPGHGDTDVDSHYGLPIISRSRAQLDAADLPPFVAAIDAEVDAIMTAHIVVPSLDDSGLPATLSRPIMTDLLRGQLGFKGVVVSDSLAMQGAKPFGDASDARVPVEALKAGVDLLLMPPKIDVAYTSVLEAVRSGEISQERLDEAVGRILTLKQKRGLFYNPFTDMAAASGVVGAPSHLAAADAITERGITLVKNDGAVLPLKPEVRNVLVTGWGVTATATLSAELKAAGLTVQTVETGVTPSATRITQARTAADTADVVVVLLNRVWTSAAQRNLIASLEASGKPVVLVSVREPYDIAHLSNVNTFVATYGYRPISMKALAKVLLGRVNPSGKLPVDIPVAGQSTILYPVGHGLNFGQ
jgi:beta-N-acetylhexosaminidase